MTATKIKQNQEEKSKHDEKYETESDNIDWKRPITFVR